jgi:hypothetical protein
MLSYARLRTLSQRCSDLDLICASVLGRLSVAEITRGQYTRVRRCVPTVA